MCGILGIADRKEIRTDLLAHMQQTMHHRGPNDSGVWMNGEMNVGLAHKRLSIIDLSRAGRQPMSDEEGKIWITFNGEIYNFFDIREDLKQKYRFTNHTDTEVIINAYKEWGTDCLRRFNGMFAFGIYDDRNKIVFLARDRVGKKPLYYSQHNGRFSFASEIKALTRDKVMPQEIDIQALNYYLSFGYIPYDMCIFKAVRKLPPAHALLYHVRSGEKKIWRYWEVPFLTAQTHPEEALLEELEALLEDAVRLRMVSDVPLGAFLSGGVDSSLVVALMSKFSPAPVKTFSIGFEEAKYNELSYATIVAKHFKTDHHEIIVRPEAFLILPELVRQFDEPFSDSSMIPTYYVSKATKEHVTVALSGDGGDELFGGYQSYLGTLGNYYIDKIIPSSLRKGISASAEYLSERFPGKRQLLRFQFDPFDAFIDRQSHAYFKGRFRKSILKDDILAELSAGFLSPELTLRHHLLSHRGDFISSLTYSDFVSYLPDDILVKVDRASMLVSLEVRAPLLDYRIVEFSFGKVPGYLKVKGKTTKYLLKRMAQKLLPKELEINRKWGFGIPISDWFRGPLSSAVEELLLDSKNEFFNRKEIEKLLDQHISGIDHSGRLFTLLVFNLWIKECFER